MSDKYLIAADSPANVELLKKIAERFPKCPIPVVANRLIATERVNLGEEFGLAGGGVKGQPANFVFYVNQGAVRPLGFPLSYENPTDNDADVKRVKAEAFAYAKSLVAPPAAPPAEVSPKK